MNFYNENDPFAARWLRNLIGAGLIPEGNVDERSIVEVRPDDLDSCTQCHFSAGIAGWSYALKLAGWPASRPVWTGSCPCQPFSCAGKRKGTADARHLWPELFRLIEECRPPTIFGEQVASKDGLRWLDGVFADLEREDYTCGACCLPACSQRAHHLRERLYWVAHNNSDQYHRTRGAGRSLAHYQSGIPTQNIQVWDRGINELVTDGITQRVSTYAEARRILDGIPGRMGQLRAYGNAVVPQVAAEFIKTCMELIP